MRKWLKGLMITVMVLTFVVSSSMTLTAATEGYLIKDTSGKVFFYQTSELEDSFINNQFGSGDDSLYLDFVDKLSKYGFYSFLNDSGKYVKYDVIESAFIQNPSNFNLNEFLDSPQAAAVSDLPASVTEVFVSNGTVTTKPVETGSSNGDATGEEPIVPEVVDIY